MAMSSERLGGSCQLIDFVGGQVLAAPYVSTLSTARRIKRRRKWQGFGTV
jgi:hypothetical protein